MHTQHGLRQVYYQAQHHGQHHHVSLERRTEEFAQEREGLRLQVLKLQLMLEGQKEEIHELKQTSHQQALEIQEQRKQILQYKQMVSSATRTAEQKADDTIAREAGQIFFAVRQFAARNFRSVRFGTKTQRVTQAGQG